MRRTLLAAPLLVLPFCGACTRGEAPKASPAAASMPEVPAPAASNFPDKVMNESTRHWITRWELFKAEAPTAKRGGVVLLGDSMTERFPADLYPEGVAIHNRGIGGDKVGGWKYYGLIDRLAVSVCDLEPSAVVVMIGVNDIVFANTPRENMHANYDRLLTEMKQCAPNARLIVLPVLPVRTTNKTFNPEIDTYNAVVKELAAKRGAEFVDIHPLFEDEMGELREELASDTIHLSREGYSIWAQALAAALTQDR